MSHSSLAPSAANRWFACPGSVMLSKDCPDESSQAAREGSFAHHIAERAMVEGRDAADFIGHTDLITDRQFVTDGFRVDEEMASYIQVYLDILREHEMLADDSRIEQRVDFSADCWGTADCAMLIGTSLHVFDFKYGRRKVDALNNKQMMVYAAALRESVNGFGEEWQRAISDVQLHIVQPRVDAAQPEEAARHGRHDIWRLPARQLDAWMESDLKPAIEATKMSSARLQAGDHCTFCPARVKCPALNSRALQSAQEVFPSGDFNAPVTPSVPTTLSPDRVRAVLDAAPLVRKWLDAVEQHAASEAKAGRVVDGYKLVATVGNRRWNDEVEAQNALRDAGVDPTVTSMISPAQAQKALGGTKHKPVIDGLCNRPVTGEKLVPVSDRRPALPGTDVFSEASNQ